MHEAGGRRFLLIGGILYLIFAILSILTAMLFRANPDGIFNDFHIDFYGYVEIIDSYLIRAFSSSLVLGLSAVILRNNLKYASTHLITVIGFTIISIAHFFRHPIPMDEIGFVSSIITTAIGSIPFFLCLLGAHRNMIEYEYE